VPNIFLCLGGPVPTFSCEAFGTNREHFTKVLSFGRCVDCHCWLLTPVALPCGHLVCLAHCQSKGQDYTCPWALGCKGRSFPSGLGSDGWRPASIAERLLGVLDIPQEEDNGGQQQDGACLQRSRWQQVSSQAVCLAQSPGRLIAAYEVLGDELGHKGHAAEAALAFMAARCLHESFETSLDEAGEILNGWAVDHVLPVINKEKSLRAKAAAWAQRCGNADILEEALKAMPVPRFSQRAQVAKLGREPQTSCSRCGRQSRMMMFFRQSSSARFATPLSSSP